MNGERIARRARPQTKERRVIETTYLFGEGIEGDPVRAVVAYYDPDGTLLAERDEWLASQFDDAVPWLADES